MIQVNAPFGTPSSRKSGILLNSFCNPTEIHWAPLGSPWEAYISKTPDPGETIRKPFGIFFGNRRKSSAHRKSVRNAHWVPKESLMSSNGWAPQEIIKKPFLAFQKSF